MAAEHHIPHPGDSAFWKLAAVIVFIVVAGVIGSRFLPDVGLAKPGDGPRAVVADTAQVAQVLAEDGDFQTFTEALKVAIVARRTCPVRNTGDGRVLHIIDGAIDGYSAYREVWQTELEGEWDPETLGDPVYWRATHPGLELPVEAGEVTLEQVKEAALAHAQAALDDAFEEIER